MPRRKTTILPGMSERILRAIRDSGQSVAGFAERAGIAQPTLQGLVKGKRRDLAPGADIAVRICRTAGVSLDWLLTGKTSTEYDRRQDGNSLLRETSPSEEELREELLEHYQRMDRPHRTLLVSIARSFAALIKPKRRKS